MEVAEAQALYRLRPDEFVAARNALAKELRADGRRDDAAVVAKLRRPSPVAWALNQVAADDPSLIDAALAAGERLQEASVAAASGRGDELRAAAAESRTATDALVRAAAGMLGARGAAARPALADTVRAAVLDPDVAAELRAGRLTEEHEAPGFGLSADAVPAAATAAAGDRAAQRAAEAEERKRRQAAEAEAAKLEREAERLEAAAADREREASSARDAADKARSAADAARAAVDSEPNP